MPQEVFLKDYKVPPFLIEEVDLIFDIHDSHTNVTSITRIIRNPSSQNNISNLTLVGEELELIDLKINGIKYDNYIIEGHDLIVKDVPDDFVLTCGTKINPEKNTALEGLYKSGGMFCTQCEAEGFRRITYFLDRPDVMAIYNVKIIADKTKYPILLSNGNKIGQGNLENNRHYVNWHDPFKKPCYLFALVAGDLKYIEDRFTTCSGREIALQIFTDAHNIDKCDHAMESLKKSMKWDEEVYGREYDLDLFMIVAVDSFNMGAMENKGLNIFNSSCVLAKPETATDDEYKSIEAIVAHEYFHNWSGNRVTCRDWFQLSLKEGLTVFRDQSFSADQWSDTVCRIKDVNYLRTYQFAEDASPMSHPVLPESYIDINNFYTLTVYEKGAELIRMMYNILGAKNYRKGTDLYFDRHDGQAVTTDDFVKALEDASGINLTQFKLWYTQSGTPKIDVTDSYDADSSTYTLTLKQSCPNTPNQTNKKPFHVPVKFGLLDNRGNDISLPDGDVLNLMETEKTYTFNNIDDRPIPSLLRGFSAPVKLNFNYSSEQLKFIANNDDDGFNRWNAVQQLSVNIILSGNDHSDLVDIIRSSLNDKNIDKELVLQIMALPAESYIGDLQEIFDVDYVHNKRESVRLAIATELEQELLQCYKENSASGYTFDADAVASRSIKNAALSYLMLLDKPEYNDVCYKQFSQADNMTDSSSAFRCLVGSSNSDLADKAISEFYDKWEGDNLVMDTWLSVQASFYKNNALAKVKQLLEHSAFDITNPNKVRSVVSVFCGRNNINFHNEDGSGYKFLGDFAIKLDDINPQIAAKLITPLTKWRRYNDKRQKLMKEQLERIAAKNNISNNVYEVVSKSIK